MATRISSAMGITRDATVHPDDPDKILVKTENHLEREIFQLNADQRAGTEGERFGDIRHVARIPLDTYFRLKSEGVLDDQQSLRRWLMTTDEGRLCRTFRGV